MRCTVNILTSNIGQPYFLDESLSFEEAKERALADLWDPLKGGYRAEFLARFTGIFCFNRLSLSTIEAIAEKGLATLNGWIEQPDLEMPREDLAAMCRDQYDPTRGARSILIGWVENRIASEVAEVILRNPQQRGTIRVSYDSAAKQIRTSLAADASTAAAV
jgi:ATP-dependent Clp protease ATP-binding subunit ClpB